MFYDKSWLWTCRAWLVTPYGLLWQYLWWLWCRPPNSTTLRRGCSSQTAQILNSSHSESSKIYDTTHRYSTGCCVLLRLIWVIWYPLVLISVLERVRNVGWSHTTQVGSIHEESPSCQVPSDRMLHAYHWLGKPKARREWVSQWVCVCVAVGKLFVCLHMFNILKAVQDHLLTN